MTIVDDDLSVRRSLCRLMSSCGIQVEAFASAQEFLDGDLDKGIDCLILDVYLGGMSGIELLEQIAAAGEPPPIVFMSAHEDEQTRQLIRRTGAAAFLRKPFDSAELVAVVGRILGRDFGV